MVNPREGRPNLRSKPALAVCPDSHLGTRPHRPTTGAQETLPLEGLKRSRDQNHAIFRSGGVPGNVSGAGYVH